MKLLSRKTSTKEIFLSLYIFHNHSLNAFYRKITRCGLPTKMISNNDSNFIGKRTSRAGGYLRQNKNKGIYCLKKYRMVFSSTSCTPLRWKIRINNLGCQESYRCSFRECQWNGRRADNCIHQLFVRSIGINFRPLTCQTAIKMMTYQSLQIISCTEKLTESSHLIQQTKESINQRRNDKEFRILYAISGKDG